MDNLVDIFRDVVARHASRTALVDGQGTGVTFAELDKRSRRLGALCQARGIGPGDRVLVAMPVGIDLYAMLCALWSVGATVVFPEPAMGLRGVRHAVRVTRPKALCASGLYRLLRFLPECWRMGLLVPRDHAGPFHPVPVDPEAQALISFTSGSTGAPKAIPRSHRFLLAQNRAVAPLLDSQLVERDLVAFPVFVLAGLAAGRCSVLPIWRLSRPDRVSAGALADWARGQRVTRMLLPPVLCETLASGGGDLPDVRAVLTGGGPVFPDIGTALRDRLPGAEVVCVYGSTEAEPIAHLRMADVSEEDMEQMRRGGGLLAGQPVPDVSLRLSDGEILVAGAHVNESYLDPSQNAQTKVPMDGRVWHRTGDAGRLDPDGRLWLLGRLGEICQTPAGAVHPFAVETAARFWPGLRRAALLSGPVLAVEGDRSKVDVWRTEAAKLGITDIRPIDAIPMDRRHRSKVDAPALRRKLGLAP